MSKLDEGLTHIETKLCDLLSIDDVKQHPGRFTEAELGALLRKKQAVRVAIENIITMQSDGKGDKSYNVLMVAFIICADHQGEDRHKKAMRLVDEFADFIPYQDWGKKEKYGIVRLQTINADNLYSGEVNKKGIAMWAVSWEQNIK